MTEQNIIDILYYGVYYFANSYFQYFALTLLLTPKFNRFLMSLILAPISLIIFPLAENTPLQFIFPVLMFLVPGLLLFREKKSVCLFTSVIYFTFLCICDLLVSMINIKFYGSYVWQTRPVTWYSLSLTAFIFVFEIIPIVLLFVFLWRSIFRRIPVKCLNLFILFPLGQFFFVSACAYKSWNDPNYIVFDTPFVWIAVVISFFADITMFIALKDSAKLDETRERLSEAEKQMEAQLAYYDSLTEKFAEIREYRHDINNIVAVAESLLNEDISRSDGEAMISEIKERAAKTAVPMFCANPIINTVIWQKQQEAGQLGIDFSAEIDAGESFPFDKIDICSLFANLLDNAIREASGCEKGFVRLIAGRKSGVVFVTAENSSQREIKQGAKPKTTKKSGSFHGSGLDIIEKITAKYGGSFTLSAEKGTAVASAAMLPMDRSRTA
ncbi:MAG: sensor histidine kinase [Ruminiclostridium sp.]